MSFKCRLILVLLSVFSNVVFAQEEVSAETMPKAVDSLILDMQKVSDNLIVAVGIRGHILSSNDSGISWQQVETVESRADLTSVYFIDENYGWAVGHDTTILHSADGGKTWQLQYIDIEREQPLLDIQFLDKNYGVAVGAYGLFLVTQDGGKSWQEKCQYGLASSEEMIDMGYVEEGFTIDDLMQYDCEDLNLPHIYSISLSDDGNSWLAGEGGLFALSTNRGSDWERIIHPYNGSFYHVLQTSYSVLVMGLRGNLYRSDDAKTWLKLETGVTAGLNRAIETAPGKIIIVGMDGVILSSSDDGLHFKIDRRDDRNTITSVVMSTKQDNETFVVGASSGLARIVIDSRGIREITGL